MDTNVRACVRVLVCGCGCVDVCVCVCEYVGVGGTRGLGSVKV